MKTPSQWEYFTIEELSCPCCGKMDMNNQFMAEVVKLRKRCVFPFKVTSAYRCVKHDKEVSSGTGAHTTGKAIDIAVDRGLSHTLLVLLGDKFTGIGIKQHGGGRFIHLDIISSNDLSPYQGKTFFRPTVWSYK